MTEKSWKHVYQHITSNAKWTETHLNSVMYKARFTLEHSVFGTLHYDIYKSPDGSYFTDNRSQTYAPYFSGLTETKDPYCVFGATSELMMNLRSEKHINHRCTTF